MKSFFEWFQSDRVNQLKPWLILGKGPSFSKRTQFDLDQYHRISLNHAVRELPVRVAHMIDLDVVNDCGDVILRNAEFLVLPWVPHVEIDPGRTTLESWPKLTPCCATWTESSGCYGTTIAGRGGSTVIRR